MDFRNKLGIAILAGAVVFAGILIFSNPERQKESLANRPTSTPFQAESFLLQKENQKLGVINLEDLSGLLTNQTKTKNLTQQLAETLAQGFIRENPSNKDLSSGLKTPQESFIWNQFSQEIQDSALLAGQTLELKDLNIHSDNSKEKVKAYFGQLGGAIQSFRLKTVLPAMESLRAFGESQNPDYLLPVVKNYDRFVEELKKIVDKYSKEEQ